MSKEYNLKFHEALKRAVEDGVEIEELDTCGDAYAYYYKDGVFYHNDGSGPSVSKLNIMMLSKWRVIEKPKRVEFECEWKKSEFSSQTTVKDENGFLDEASKFIGKRTRVIIEEIL